MKVKINKDLIEHVAEVARLRLTDKEIEKFSKEIKEVIEAFSKLDKADTTGIEPSLQAVELKNMLRDDEIEKSFTQKEFADPLPRNCARYWNSNIEFS